MRLSGKKKAANARNPHIDRERPKVFSYSSARAGKERPLNRGGEPPKSQDKESSSLSKAINIVIILFVLASFAYLSVLDTNAQVKITGEKVFPREKSSYENKIDELLKKSVFNKSKLTFDEAKLAAEVKKEFPEVNTIKVSVPLVRHRPTIEVTLAKPAAKLVTNEKAYILDGEGRALFEEAQAASALDVNSLLAINDSSGHEITLGKPALTQAQIGFINELIGQVSTKDIKPRSFALSEGGTAVDVRFEEISYFVKFNFYADAKQSSGAFIALYEQINSSGPKPQQYVDLRIPDKAFIK